MKPIEDWSYRLHEEDRFELPEFAQKLSEENETAQSNLINEPEVNQLEATAFPAQVRVPMPGSTCAGEAIRVEDEIGD
eukprot:10888185-Karenia_brevis.AAC.1